MTGNAIKPGLEHGRRVVVKIGSSLLVDSDQGTIHRRWLESLGADIARCRKRGQSVLIVSSGAIAVGRRHLGLAEGELRLEEKQAAAATGMVRLAHAYQEILAHHELTVAQVLLTLDDSRTGADTSMPATRWNPCLTSAPCP
jgi:glutamate 5-kinase